jgi:cysteinyl-tRNA synthetase
MTLKIHNTLSRQKEVFTPIDEKRVRLYACGPTVYNYAHIGNARPAVIFDLLSRVLRQIYGEKNVVYTRNITDIDDKIIDAARETGEAIDVITEKFARIYNDDMAALGVRAPDHQPRATHYLPQMIKMVEDLIAAGKAYAADGHVLFNVPSWPDYGQLSRRNRDDMIAGARVEVAPYKKDPADFVLWKPSTPDQPGWDSPWGRGRPGWHLECSAMNAAINGAHFDIHAGGEDLIFPHHENEIAQSVCAHDGKPYVNYWMHNGFLMVEGKKMSKSLGNFLLVHDLIKQHPPEALRLVLLSAHYRQPIDFTMAGVEQATKTLDYYYTILQDAGNITTGDVPAPVMAALCDDLNTPQALTEMAALAKARDLAGLKSAGALLGLLQQKPKDWLQRGAGDQKTAIEKLVAEWQAARNAKNYAEADRLRDTLKTDYSVSVSVTKDGIQWRRD